MAKGKDNGEGITIVKVDRGLATFCILGTTPIILNRMSEKAMHELLMPKKKTAADRASSLKHDPMTEFLASPYIDPNEDGPTYIQHLSTAFKCAIKDSALDVPGSSKAQIGRLCWVERERLPIYGIPKMLMSVTRSADMNKTPDVRTRCIVPQWATQITVSYVKPILNETSIVNLVVSAGMCQGIGDWRTGKGSGTFGAFEVVNKTDPRYLSIMKNGGRKAQVKAMDNVEYYDKETEDLFAWFQKEVKARGVGDRLKIRTA